MAAKAELQLDVVQPGNAPGALLGGDGFDQDLRQMRSKPTDFSGAPRSVKIGRVGVFTSGETMNWIKMHWIKAAQQMKVLGLPSKRNARMNFLLHLKAIGRRSTIDIGAKFL